MQTGSKVVKSGKTFLCSIISVLSSNICSPSICSFYELPSSSLKSQNFTSYPQLRIQQKPQFSDSPLGLIFLQNSCIYIIKFVFPVKLSCVNLIIRSARITSTRRVGEDTFLSTATKIKENAFPCQHHQYKGLRKDLPL